jgi:hypothetical protein
VFCDISFLGQLVPEDDVKTIIRNIGAYSASNTAPHHENRYLKQRRYENRCLFFGSVLNAKDVFKENRRYRNLKHEALDRTLWRTSFGRSF